MTSLHQFFRFNDITTLMNNNLKLNKNLFEIQQHTCKCRALSATQKKGQLDVIDIYFRL
jgi:hypothetical protein